MSAIDPMTWVTLNPPSMTANRRIEAWSRYFGGNRAKARMKRGHKTAHSSARRRLDKTIIREALDEGT